MAIRKNPPRRGVMMLLGTGAGLAVGVALDSVAIGTAVGAGLGLLVDLVISRSGAG